MSHDPNSEQLVASISQDVSAELRQRSAPTAAAGPDTGLSPVGAVGAFALPDLSALIPGLVKSLLDIAVTQFGDDAERLVAEHRERIRSVLSDTALKAVDDLIHQLRDPAVIGR